MIRVLFLAVAIASASACYNRTPQQAGKPDLTTASEHFASGNVFALQSVMQNAADIDNAQTQLFRASLDNAFKRFDKADAVLSALESDKAVAADVSLRALTKRERYLHHALQGEFAEALGVVKAFSEEERAALPAPWRESIASAGGFLPFLASIPAPTIDDGAGDAHIVAPFDEAIGGWVLDGEVNGEPARLVIDTGASVTLIRESSAARFNLKRVGSDGEMKNLVGETAIVPFAAADEIMIGGVAYYNALVLVVPDAQFGGHDFDALLGHNVVAALGHFKLNPNTGDISRITSTGQPPEEHAPNMAIVNTSLMVNTEIGDTVQTCLFDTAADAAITRRMFNEFEDPLSLVAVERSGGGDIFPGSDAPIRLPVVEQITIKSGGARLNMGRVVEILPAETTQEETVPCIIGRNVMRGMKEVELDFYNMRARFTP